MWGTRLLVVFTVFALTLANNAEHLILITLAIVLLALGLLTIAALEMLVLVHFNVKGGDISPEYYDDGFLSFILELVFVFAAAMIAMTSRSTLWIVFQAVTVQFETLGVLALASLAPYNGWLVLLDLKQLLLGLGHFHYLQSFLFDLLLLLLNIVFILLFWIEAKLFGVWISNLLMRRLANLIIENFNVAWSILPHWCFDWLRACETLLHRLNIGVELIDLNLRCRK